MYISQKQVENLRVSARAGKVVVAYGARRTGKTTRRCRSFLKPRESPIRWSAAKALPTRVSGQPVR